MTKTLNLNKGKIISVVSLFVIFGLLAMINVFETKTSVELILVEQHEEGFKFRISKDGSFISYRKAMELLATSDLQTINSLSQTIISTRHDAIFWECTPITRASFDLKPFEFIVLPSHQLAASVVDIHSFQEKFSFQSSDGKDVIVFQNLGGDSTLVVPTPTNAGGVVSQSSRQTPQHMAHLSSFIKGAPHSQVVSLWRHVGEEMLRSVEHQSDPQMPLWLSTSGLGVAWLHVRIDTRPKYYNWKEYKEVPIIS